MSLLPARSLIGVIHLPALPGAVLHRQPLPSIVERACDEARMLTQAGFDALIVENFGDTPFHAAQVEPHTVAAMSVVLTAVRQAVGVPLGVNVLRNDALAALGIAASSGAQFIRVNVLTGVYATDQGLVEGRAAEVMAYRRRLAADVAVLADVHVKHAQPLSQPDIALAAEETAYRGLADALIVSGPTTGRPADADQVLRVKQAVPDRPILVGSGVTVESVANYLSIADGVIVASDLRQDGRAGFPLDHGRVDRFVSAARTT